MKRQLATFAGVLFFGGGVLVLLWLGNYFNSYASSRDILSVEESTPIVLPLGTAKVFDLRGGGFNKKTIANLVMDINNTEAIVGSIPLEGIYNDSLLYGDYLYLASSLGGLQVLDIQDPHQPRLFKEYLAGRSIFDVYRNGEYLYLCCTKLGVSIMQIQQDGTLKHINDVAVESLALNCQVFDGYLFIVGGKGGLSIYDVRQPKQVQLVKIVRAASFASKVLISGEFLYLSDDENKIEIYQLAVPQMPLLVGSFQLSAKVFDLVVCRQLLYVASEAGLSLYGLSDPRQPILMQHWVDFGSAKRLFAGLEHIYISDSFSGLRRVAADDQEPSAYFSLNVDPRVLSETADYLYVAGSNKGLLVVDKKKLSRRQ